MSNGQFKINLSSSIDNTSSSSLTQSSFPAIEISSPGYESVEIIPYKGDGTLKTDLGVVPLIPLTVALEKDKIKASQLNTKQIKELTKENKGADYFIQEQLSNQISDIKKTLTPAILTMIASFGITGASLLIAKNQDKIINTIKNKSKCPSPAELTDLIDKKNKLVKKLNISYQTINTTTAALGVTANIVNILDKALLTQNITLSVTPTSTGVPGVPGVPVGTITGIDDTKDNNKTLIKKLTHISSGITSTLFIFSLALSQAVGLLNLLDKLIEHCYPNAAGQEPISIELTELTNQQSQQQSPIVTNVRGFKISVETEVTDKSLKRRRAIATNKQNIVMLKGEWSFSSIDQILINELIFYIQQNNLKTD